MLLLKLQIVKQIGPFSNHSSFVVTSQLVTDGVAWKTTFPCHSQANLIYRFLKIYCFLGGRGPGATEVVGSFKHTYYLIILKTHIYKSVSYISYSQFEVLCLVPLYAVYINITDFLAHRFLVQKEF